MRRTRTGREHVLRFAASIFKFLCDTTRSNIAYAIGKKQGNLSIMSISESIRTWARRIKRDAVMLWFARQHRDTPFLAKALCVFTVAYALSPIDLIPDFVPVLGYVDDALLLPSLIWLAVRMLPAHVIEQCRAQAEEWMAREKSKPRSYAGAIAIVLIWIGALYLCWWWYQTR